MRSGWKWLASGAGGTLAGVAAAAAIENWRWNRSTSRAAAQLLTRLHVRPARVYSPEQLEGLPAPVARFFHFSLTPGQRSITRARVEQAGQFRTGIEGRWSSFTAVQHYAVDRPGFVWDARIRMGPGVSVRVRDRYAQGQAAIQAKAAALIPLVDERPRPELNEGALHRYLAEAVWLPTALLPSKHINWHSVDNTAAVATLTDGLNQVWLQFDFGTRGEIVRAHTPGRWRAVVGGYVRTPWTCYYRRYLKLGEMRMPAEAEVAWDLPEGPCSYFHGRLTTVNHAFD